MPSGSYNDSLAMKRADVDHVEWSLAGLVAGPMAIVAVTVSVGLATTLLLLATGVMARISPGAWFATNVVMALLVVIPNLLIFGRGYLRLTGINWALTGGSSVVIVLSNYYLSVSLIQQILTLIPALLATWLLATWLLTTKLFRRQALNAYVSHAAIRDAKRQLQRQLGNETR